MPDSPRMTRRQFLALCLKGGTASVLAAVTPAATTIVSAAVASGGAPIQVQGAQGFSVSLAQQAATTGLFWRNEEGYDIHVLTGQTSHDLRPYLMIRQSGGDAVPATPLPSDVTSVKFLGEFAGSPSAHGVTVNTGTDEVTVANAFPAGPRLYNFLLRASVTHTNPDPAVPNPLEIRIRIHIHKDIDNVWLTPNPLTVRRDAQDPYGAVGRLSVLAQFDDKTVGDLSYHPSIHWDTSDPGMVAVDHDAGWLAARADVGKATITAKLPTNLGNKSATAQVNVEAPWSTPIAATLIQGSPGLEREPGIIRTTDFYNILFLPDGFTNKAQFERLVQLIVQDLRTSPTTQPFKLLRRAINYWMAFIPSRQQRVGVR